MKILVTGDTYLGSTKLQKASEKGQVNEIFGPFLTHIRESDLAITNLESPVINEGTPINKTGPALKASLKSLGILKSAGFDLVTLANNHIRDYGHEGVFSTLQACEKLNLNYVGAGENLSNAMETFYYEKGDIKVGIINIAENEFGTTQGLYPGAHPQNIVDNYYSIKEAKEEADKVVVIVHGGHELYTFPSPRMKKNYRFFVDAGADAVVGHHTHWHSGFEVYKSAPIFYGLGNFLFENIQNVNSPRWHVGFGVSLDLEEQNLKFQIISYKQNAGSLGIETLNAKEEKEFNDELSLINNIIQDDHLLENEFNDFCRSKRKLYNYYLEPHSSYILQKIQRLKLMPSLWSPSKLLLLKNLIMCEAHRDVLLKHLK